MLELISTEELAAKMRYSGANSAFREWLVSMGITPVPGRRGFYDPRLVRKRLDEAQGIDVIPEPVNDGGEVVDWIAQRRSRSAAS